MKLKGAQILIEALKKEGVEFVFGIPGGSVLTVFDALYRSSLKLILTRHEQGATHMADGYARASGKPGVCIVTSGPGATNAVTGIATAYMDSIPMICITGQVKTFLIGNDAFQEADMIGISRPITKHSYLVKDVNDLARVVREAFHIATTGRPGPVVIDLPADVSFAEAEFKYPSALNLRGYKPVTEGHPKQIEKAAQLILASKKPVLYVGGGCLISNASPELGALARKAGIPVTTTLAGLGAFPETEPLSLGMLGMHGTMYANYAVQRSDLLIAVGARFDDRVTGNIQMFAPHAKVIHIDIDPASISKNVKVDVPIVGDAKNVLKELLLRVGKLDIKDWRDQVLTWKRKHPLRYKRESSNIKPQFVIETISRLTKGEAVIATGVGQHQMWTAQWYKFTKPRSMITSGGLGTMGFGFPAGIGAQIGRPDETVFVIDGDGSFQMTMTELSTAVHYKLPVKVAILDNSYLGMVRQWQELFYGKRYSGSELATMNPDFVKFAEAFGVKGIRVKKKNEVASAIQKAMAYPGPVILHFVVEPEENVYPMVPAGQALDQMIDMA